MSGDHQAGPACPQVLVGKFRTWSDTFPAQCDSPQQLLLLLLEETGILLVALVRKEGDDVFDELEICIFKCDPVFLSYMCVIVRERESTDEKHFSCAEQTLSQP